MENPNRREVMPTLALRSLFSHKSIIRILAILAICVIFLLPIYRLIMLSFTSDGNLTFANYTTILQDAATWQVMKNTLIVVAGSTVISLIIGVSLAWLVAYTDIRAKRVMQLFIVLPFVIPSYITTLAWTQFLGTDGLYMKLASLLPFSVEPINLYSLAGIIFVLGLSHYPLVYLLTVSVFGKIPRELELASRASGAKRWTTFRKVNVPLAMPGIVSGGFLAFLANLDNFGIPAFLGIPAQINVLSTYIYQQVVGFGPSAFARAATFSVLLGMVALIGTAIQWLFLRKSKRLETTIEDKQPRYFLGKRKWLIELIIWLFFSLTGVVPLISMGMTSLITAYGVDFSLQTISLENYQFILNTSSKAKEALGNSAMLAGVTAVIGIVIGTAIAYLRVRKPNFLSKFTEVSIGLPYALPGTVMALSMIFAWMEPVPGWNPGIYGSIMILFIAYITRFLILQVRGSITAIMQVDLSMEEAAHVSGAKGWSKWRKILLPLLFPGVLTGAFLVFLSALTELTVSSLLWSSNSETIGVVIFGFEQAGYTTYSTAFSSLIVMLIILGFTILYLAQSYWNRKVGKRT
ncbi:iron ABC transporter permease [Gracilibacillus caseinilyticus]|uniref:Iron ABC transporter permease n=1 Tax=Gracilibacillus caseinilyticus TaxID=2932256 RepID=A0ABY4EWH3_9BACI|nr:iron ABC transporter permease [Gracilibacillus caseinilyticus]UOQ48772.1 iron ABC transporter permease [Gracilibacillus caseinilyticus]